MEKEGFKVSKSLVSPLGLRVSGGFIPHSDAYKRGLVTVQDESAMLAVDSMDVKSTDVVLMVVLPQAENDADCSRSR